VGRAPVTKATAAAAAAAAGRKRDDGRATGWIPRAAKDACAPASLERHAPGPRKQRLTTWNRRTLAETKRITLQAAIFSCADVERRDRNTFVTSTLRRRTSISARLHFLQQRINNASVVAFSLSVSLRTSVQHHLWSVTLQSPLPV